MRCGVELRRQEAKQKEWRVECYKCRKEGHKCKEYSLWEKVKRRRVEEKKAVCVAIPQKVQQKELRRVEEKEVACMAKLREVQQGKGVWRRSLAHVL